MRVLKKCVKPFSITAENGDHFSLTEGKVYHVSEPRESDGAVVVFKDFWVPVPEEHFGETVSVVSHS